MIKYLKVIYQKQQWKPEGKWIVCSLYWEKNARVHAKSLQLCPAVCDPVARGPPGSSVHGILQAGVLEWVAVCSCRGSSRPRDGTQVSYVSCIAGGFFTTSAIWEALVSLELYTQSCHSRMRCEISQFHLILWFLVRNMYLILSFILAHSSYSFWNFLSDKSCCCCC